MATECQLDCSDEDSKMLDEAEERGVLDWSPETYAEVMPEVERAIAERCVECLEENAENVANNINEQIAQRSEELTDIDKLDQEVLPTHQQLDEMVKIGQELGVDETEIISTPLICRTSGVEDMDEKIKDVMWALHTQEKIPPWYRDDEVFSKIMFVDRQETGTTGLKRADFNPVTRVMHVYRDAKGKFPTKEEIKQEILPHEITHASEKFRQRIWDSGDELIDVIQYEQTLTTISGKQPAAISPYVEKLGEVTQEGEMSDEIRLINEWVGEAVVKYVKEECSEITQKFFGEIFSEE